MAIFLRKYCQTLIIHWGSYGWKSLKVLPKQLSPVPPKNVIWEFQQEGKNLFPFKFICQSFTKLWSSFRTFSKMLDSKTFSNKSVHMNAAVKIIVHTKRRRRKKCVLNLFCTYITQLSLQYGVRESLLYHIEYLMEFLDIFLRGLISELLNSVVNPR